MTAKVALRVVNLHEARYECTFGRGCEGTCCRNGRPGLYPDEQQVIAANLDKFLPHLRPEARRLVGKNGFLTRRTRYGLPLVAVVKGWCVFFHQGCVLHKVGAAEGDKYRYKPACCSLFPLVQGENGDWYVRQKGYRNEPWDLFCLDPHNSTLPAATSLQEELRLAERIVQEKD